MGPFQKIDWAWGPIGSAHANSGHAHAGSLLGLESRSGPDPAHTYFFSLLFAGEFSETVTAVFENSKPLLSLKLSQTLLIPTFDSNTKPKTHLVNPSMADHNNGSGGGDVVDRPEDEGGPMVVEREEQQLVGAVEGLGAEVAEGDGDGSDQRPVRRWRIHACWWSQG